MRELIKQPKSKFLKVQCFTCKNEQIIFNKASADVKCLVCGNILARATGGMSIIKSKILKVLS
ncbi:MAG: 30S ribosomal protein S27e [Candidatus Aenigmarchaeota archaeon]|nr:30S ribosomal protein S27e [Candidatus Aenigmarchaeota archaeon]